MVIYYRNYFVPRGVCDGHTVSNIVSWNVDGSTSGGGWGQPVCLTHCWWRWWMCWLVVASVTCRRVVTGCTKIWWILCTILFLVSWPVNSNSNLLLAWEHVSLWVGGTAANWMGEGSFSGNVLLLCLEWEWFWLGALFLLVWCFSCLVVRLLIVEWRGWEPVMI